MCRRPYNSRGSGQMCSRAPPLAATPVDPVAMILQTQQLMQQTMQQMLALQQSSVTATPGSSQPTTRSLVKCPDWPAIDADSTDSDWAMFMDSWSHYKVMSKISDQTEIRNELRSTSISLGQQPSIHALNSNSWITSNPLLSGACIIRKFIVRSSTICTKLKVSPLPATLRDYGLRHPSANSGPFAQTAPVGPR